MKKVLFIIWWQFVISHQYELNFEIKIFLKFEALVLVQMVTSDVLYDRSKITSTRPHTLKFGGSKFETVENLRFTEKVEFSN